MRLQHDAAKRDEVLDRDMAGQAQPVGAGDGDAEDLQAARQRVDETVALAHQNQHVARAQRAALAFDDVGLADPAGDRPGDGIGQLHGRRRRMIDRFAPVVRLLDRGGADRRPDLDIARRAGADRLVLDRLGIARQPLAGAGAGENPVDGGEDIVGRPERPVEFHRLEAALGGAHALVEEAAAVGKQPGIGALEGIDRLLFVADRKDGAVHAVARSEAGKEIFGEAPHHIPLVGAGVLGFVDQDVIDALVELVLHPGADIGTRQQPRRAGDQVVEIEKAARCLHPLVAGDQPVGHHQRRRRCLQHAKQRQPVGGGEDRGGGGTIAFERGPGHGGEAPA